MGIRIIDTGAASTRNAVQPIVRPDGTPARADIVASNDQYVFVVESEPGSAEPGSILVGKFNQAAEWTPIGELMTDEPLARIWVSAGFLYSVGLYTASVAVVDVRTGSSPEEVARLNQVGMTTSYVWSIEPDLFVLGTDGDRQILTHYSISDVNAVREVGSIELVGRNRSTGVVGTDDGHLYITDRGLRLIGQEETGALVERDYVPLLGGVNDLASVPGGALVASDNGLWLLQRREGTYIFELLQMRRNAGYPIEAIESRASTAYIVESRGRVTSLSVGDNDVTELAAIDVVSQRTIEQFILEDDVLFVSGAPERGGLRNIVSLRAGEDGTLAQIGVFQTELVPRSAFGRFIAGATDAQMQVVDAHDPQSMRLVASTESPGAIESMLWSNDGATLYVVDGRRRGRFGGNEVFALEIAEQEQLRVLDSERLSGDVSAATLEGNYVIVAGLNDSGKPGLHYVDVSRPDALSLGGFLSLPFGSYRGQLPREVVSIGDGLVLVGTSSSGLFVVDSWTGPPIPTPTTAPTRDKSLNFPLLVK